MMVLDWSLVTQASRLIIVLLMISALIPEKVIPADARLTVKPFESLSHSDYRQLVVLVIAKRR